MELLRRVCGVSLFGRRVPLLLYADEIALLARNPLEIQKMLDVVFIAAAVSYKYLGIEFCSSGRWDEFLKRILAKVKSATNLLAWKIRVHQKSAPPKFPPHIQGWDDT